MKNAIFLLTTCLLILAGARGAGAQVKAEAVPGKPEVILVKGGTFSMGRADAERDEAPVHRVTVHDFSIGKYPVTVGQYKKFCEATKRKMPKAPDWGWHDDHPMVNVTYYDAVNYCKWLSRQYGGQWRLPSEAEWEYAARGGSQSGEYPYSGSDDLEAVGWFQDNSGDRTHTVGCKKPNELGIYDMSGNVWEWCGDWYAPGYYAESPAEDPVGPVFERPAILCLFSRCRVLRGGNWYLGASYCRVTDRSYHIPKRKWYNRGFRVVFLP
jgi:formylglycine-generating enzyme required for sulfatase activity